MKQFIELLPPGLPVYTVKHDLGTPYIAPFFWMEGFQVQPGLHQEDDNTLFVHIGTPPTSPVTVLILAFDPPIKESQDVGDSQAQPRSSKSDPSSQRTRRNSTKAAPRTR